MATRRWLGVADALRSRVRVALLVAVVLLWVFVMVAGSVVGRREMAGSERPAPPVGDFSVSPRSDPLEFAFGFGCP